MRRGASWRSAAPALARQLHQVHHSAERAETDSNFGFNLPWWDRLFGATNPNRRPAKTARVVGFPICRDRGELRIARLLTQPFRDDKAAKR